MATIELKAEKFEELLADRGALTNVAAGKLLGLHNATVSKIRSGKARPGEHFIALALQTFPITFDELFRVA